jgi:hypothetical protein
MKGAATVEELRRAVETLKRNDRRTRARLTALESAESEWIRLADVAAEFDATAVPTYANTCEPLAFGSLYKLPADVIPPPPPGANPSGVLAFLRGFFARFTRAA